MIRAALERLVSPVSGRSLSLEASRTAGDRVLEGHLTSREGERYPIRGGVPRFVGTSMEPEQKQTVDTFAFKWSRIPSYASDPRTKSSRERWYFERFGFESGDADLKAFLAPARSLLEAGTGTGVDTDLLVRNSNGIVFGVDISSAVDEANRRFQDHPRVALLQADIGRLPFGPGSFDFISCDQVLHHTPDPVANFSRLAGLLAPGGHLLVYVYKVKGPLREFADDHLRARMTVAPVEEVVDFSERLARLGRSLSRLHATVDVEDDFPELGIAKGKYDVQRLLYDHVLKCFWNEDFEFEVNAMVNFDWYRPAHAFRYTEDDVRRWISTNGLDLVRIQVSPSGISVIARRPR